MNVLISRAKRRCEVFSSITDDDIDLSRARGKGVVAFKLFLQYARTGRLSVDRPVASTAEGMFEQQVAAALQARGYQVHPRLGIAGLFIDLAIADAQRPGRYLLGIECDGPSYQAARSARDRDRLRQSVLEDHGWVMHRIWCTDWFQRPSEQLERAVAAIEAARREIEGRLEAAGQRLRAVVDIESPVHIDEVVVRLRSAWGLQRAGSRIVGAVERGVGLAVSNGLVLREGQVLSTASVEAILPRDRGGAQSPSLRKPEMIPAIEIASGVVHVVGSHLGATDDEVALTISRMLGFKATSAPLRSMIAAVVEDLVAQGRMQRQDRMLVLTLAP